jgi:hypothetical protein
MLNFGNILFIFLLIVNVPHNKNIKIIKNNLLINLIKSLIKEILIKFHKIGINKK